MKAALIRGQTRAVLQVSASVLKTADNRWLPTLCLWCKIKSASRTSSKMFLKRPVRVIKSGSSVLCKKDCFHLGHWAGGAILGGYNWETKTFGNWSLRILKWFISSRFLRSSKETLLLKDSDFLTHLSYNPLKQSFWNQALWIDLLWQSVFRMRSETENLFLKPSGPHRGRCSGDPGVWDLSPTNPVCNQ